jgi:hypothetical protein
MLLAALFEPWSGFPRGLEVHQRNCMAARWQHVIAGPGGTNVSVHLTHQSLAV